MWFFANDWAINSGMNAFYVALGIHILAWAAQFIGHGVFEGRKPALIDNLIQSIVLAPFFVWFHVLFFFGFNKSLQADVHGRVSKSIAELKKKSK